jgi:hypothetical protein
LRSALREHTARLRTLAAAKLTRGIAKQSNESESEVR